MNDTLSKIEKRTAYTLLLPAVFLVFAIVLFPIFANIWISFKEVQLKDIRIPEPRAKKIVKSIKRIPIMIFTLMMVVNLPKIMIDLINLLIRVSKVKMKLIMIFKV